MCYSALVQQHCKKLGIEFEARIQLDAFERLFRARAQGEALPISKALEDDFLASASSAVDSQSQLIGDLVYAYRKQAAAHLEAELFAQMKRLADAERKLAAKPTQTAQKDKERAERQIARFRGRLENLHSSIEAPDDARVFPMMYAPVILAPTGTATSERIITPMRYHCRPSDEEEAFDQLRQGCYNARRDSLGGFWRKQFGRHHALLVIHGFFENVRAHRFEKRALRPGEAEKNLVLEFKPEGFDEMYVPCIYDVWERPGKRPLQSFALITDEPPPEVAETGHDRCPIFLTHSAAQKWLAPAGLSQTELFAILNERERPRYRHRVAAA